MRHIPISFNLRRVYLLILVLLIAGCSLEKKSGVNRALQNLTAHYNILFDANEILRQKQDAYALSFVDSYNDILSVYQDTSASSGTPDKDLEEVKIKAGKIINIKEQSHYLGDAYLVLGKANYLEGNYFEAVEFLGYVVRSYSTQPKLVEEALAWKARALIRLNQLPEAKLMLDTAVLNINKKTKKNIITQIYAAKLQYDINSQNYEDGEAMAKQAIHYTGEKAQELRWTFIMAQLQELNNKPAEAYKNYTSIVNSNASFEMAFNANLNRIRIQDNQNGVKVNRMDRLRALLKNANNKEFTDQVYYQIAELYFAEKDIDNAIKNYRLSVRNSRKNQNQKGLSYLRLADIYFRYKADYVGAKKYYDSTLMSLSPSYTGYQAIQKKSANLQLLADRFGTIAREDTLQMLAQLDEKARSARIDAMVNRQILQQQAIINSNNGSADSFTSGTTGTQSGTGARSTFYFYNTNALSQGFNDFKRKWGNRKLEDNWRRSSKSGGDITGASTSQNIDPDAPADQAAKGKPATAGDYRKQLTQNMPLTPELMAQSNTRVYNAYFDIGNFYRDILGDKTEAIATYELILGRFPNSPDKPALYYNLYRLYQGINNAKSDYYKNLILKNYPDTAFARIIIDPEYSQKITDADAGLNTSYNNVYDLFATKDYKGAIAAIDSLQKQQPGNKWDAQLAYLRVISAGHLEKLDPFRNDLLALVNKYPTDRLVVPLVKQHIAYVDAHRAALTVRPFALTDKDPNEEPFIPPAVEPDKAALTYNEFAEKQQQAVKQAEKDRLAREQAEKDKLAKQPVSNPSAPPAIPTAVSPPPGTNPNKPSPPDTAGTKSVIENNPVATNPAPGNSVVAPPKEVSSVFSMSDSTNYYLVINVIRTTTNLASSRFGIGQFNRANFPNGGITHQLLNVGDQNQLIYVGRFFSLSAVKDYARAMVPLLPEIMKVPKDKYSFFIITQQNLDKLSNKNMLDMYIDYYQKNY